MNIERLLKERERIDHAILYEKCGKPILLVDLKNRIRSLERDLKKEKSYSRSLEILITRIDPDGKLREGLKQ